MTSPITEREDPLIGEISHLTANMSLDASSSEDEEPERLLTIEDEANETIIFEDRSPSPELIEAKYETVDEFDTLGERFDPLSDSKVLVVVSSQGYKHKFSRMWVPKNITQTIVERPERLRACCLGIGLARTVTPLRVLNSTKPSTLYSKHFELVHGKDWATQLYSLCNIAQSKLDKKEIEVPESWPSYDIYLAPETVDALEGNIGAIELAVDEIYSGDSIKRAFVAVRPPGHHCNESDPSGFCIINNAHIAIQYGKLNHNITHAVILDFDLHHGDGSQDLLWKLGYKSDGMADIPIGYFSLHDINSFPCETGFAHPQKLTDASVCFVAHNCAVWNVHLQDFETEEEFNKLYETVYSILFEKASLFLDQQRRKSVNFNPLVVVSAGFDGSEFESPGMQRHQVHVPTSFYNRFTRDCVALANEYSRGHILSLMEGGYSSPAIATGVFSHLTGLSGIEYQSEWCPPSTTPSEINMGMRQRWKAHVEKWTANGIQLGRTLFPAPPEPHSAPTSPNDRIKHNLRKRRTNWSR